MTSTLPGDASLYAGRTFIHAIEGREQSIHLDRTKNTATRQVQIDETNRDVC